MKYDGSFEEPNQPIESQSDEDDVKQVPIPPRKLNAHASFELESIKVRMDDDRRSTLIDEAERVIMEDRDVKQNTIENELKSCIQGCLKLYSRSNRDLEEIITSFTINDGRRGMNKLVDLCEF